MSVATNIHNPQSTIVETSTTQVIATVEAQATSTIPVQPIVNSDLESYITTGNLSPWISSANGGKIEPVNGVNPCTSGGTCAGGRVVIRVYPPTTGGGYSSFKETFTARPSRQYSASFMYRCLKFDSTSRIDTYYNGVLGGSAICSSTSTAFNLIPHGAITFSTDATGVGEIEFRFYNPSNSPDLYFYADRFQATLV